MGEKAFDQHHQAEQAALGTLVLQPESAGPGPLCGLREWLAGRSRRQQPELALPDLLHRLRVMADDEVERYLTSLPGVARKTALCVMLYTLGRAVLPVDTHVWRVAQRLDLAPADGWSEGRGRALEATIPTALRGSLHRTMIAHGRQVCRSRRPSCGSCVLADLCSAAGANRADRSPLLEHDIGFFPGLVESLCQAWWVLVDGVTVFRWQDQLQAPVRVGQKVRDCGTPCRSAFQRQQLHVVGKQRGPGIAAVSVGLRTRYHGCPSDP